MGNVRTRFATFARNRFSSKPMPRRIAIATGITINTIDIKSRKIPVLTVSFPTAILRNRIGKLPQPHERCCNQVEMSPGLQSRNVTTERDRSKAQQPGDLKFRRAEKPCRAVRRIAFMYRLGLMLKHALNNYVCRHPSSPRFQKSKKRAGMGRKNVRSRGLDRGCSLQS